MCSVSTQYPTLKSWAFAVVTRHNLGFPTDGDVHAIFQDIGTNKAIQKLMRQTLVTLPLVRSYSPC